MSRLLNNRDTKKLAQLSSALYVKALILDEKRDYEAALAALSASRAISVQLNGQIDVAFADAKRCAVLVNLNRPDEAETACREADKVWKRIGRLDMAAATADNLARIDLIRGHPAAALDRLNRIIRSSVEMVALSHRPELYQHRSEALSRLGRFQEALRDLQEANRLTASNDAQRRQLAAAAINQRFSEARVGEEKRALEAQMVLERQQAATKSANRICSLH